MQAAFLNVCIWRFAAAGQGPPLAQVDFRWNELPNLRLASLVIRVVGRRAAFFAADNRSGIPPAENGGRCALKR